MAMAEMNREPLAEDLLAVVATRSIDEAQPRRKSARSSLPWSHASAELRALYAIALQKVRPADPKIGKLIEWLLNPVNMATWSQAAGTLPTRRAALIEMPRDPYVTFMYTQLETALPYPTSETHLRIYRAMQQAINAVLREGVSPETAAENILEAVNQETS